MVTTVTPRPTRRPSAFIPLMVLVVLVAISMTMFVVSRRVADDQERRLLRDRTGEVASLLSTATYTLGSSLQVLGTFGTLDSPDAGRLFGQAAAPLLVNDTVGMGVAVRGDYGYNVVAAVGDVPGIGTPLSGDRAALLARAASVGGLVSAIVEDPRGKRLLFAAPQAGDRSPVAYQDNLLHPQSPDPQAPGSPFRELRVALYASATADPAALMLSTEARLPLTGAVDQVPFPVGADQWTLVVGTRGPLMGSFAQRAPWLLLGGGLLAAVFAAAAAQVLSRRRAYALALVHERTGELDDTRAFLDRLVTGAPVVVRRFTGPDAEISYVSPNIEREFGTTAAEALTESYLSRVHPEDRSTFEAAYQLVAEGAAARQTIEYRRCNSEGAYRWVSSVFIPETDHDGKISAVLGYALDINDRRRAEQAHVEAQQAADAANRAKSEFLSRMSHELRTPLNAVVGFGQLLQLDDLNEDQRESVEQILKGGRHLLDLINEVLDISRIEAGELALSPEPVLVSELVNEAVGLMRPLGEQHGIQIVEDRSGKCERYIYADRQRVKQVLLNLLSNAVKYNRPRGTVAVTCAQPTPTTVSISVTDTGPGIAQEWLPKIFAPFERLGAENTGVEGTGIGLALSQRLVQAMSGRLTVTSTLGRGSTFAIELACAEGPIERYERLQDGPAAASPAAERCKILYIEDNLSNLKLVERITAMRGDIEVIPSMHGGLGLELAREHNPFLIILDLHLPDMNGAEVLRRLREDPLTASIPVVMASADASPGQAQRLIAAGALAYLTKPIDVGELLQIIDRRLPREPDQ